MKEPPFGFIVNGKWYATCPACENTIRMNKPIIGDLHICLTPEEIAERQKRGEL